MREILYKHNVHWSGKSIHTGVSRNLLPKLIDALEVKHVIAIAGSRRSGKSYLFRQIHEHLTEEGVSADNILKINFEDPYFISRKTDPTLLDEFYSEYLTVKNPQGRQYIFLDEIQNIKEWQYWLRDMYDRHEELKFFATGSNADMLSVEIDTHLTGRVIPYENFPFSLSELLRSVPHNDISVPENTPENSIGELLYHDKEKLLHHIERAFRFSFFPEVCNLSNEDLASDILNQYFTNVLFKDIIPRFSIRNSRVVEELAYYLSTNFTSEFSYNKLAKIVSSNENTVKDYISFFEKAYLFYVLPFFEYSLKKQLRREKKIYISDVGLRTATAFQFSQDTGRYVENLVFNALRSQYKNIYYWKSKTGSEIDFLIRHKGTIIAVNVCYADVMPEREFIGFKHLAHENISTVKNVLVSKNLSYRVEVDSVFVEVVPIWEFLLTV